MVVSARVGKASTKGHAMKVIAVCALLCIMLFVGCELQVGTIEYKQQFVVKDVDVKAPGVMHVFKK